MDYSAKVERLEQILESMERTAMPLEETLALYDEGQKLLKECREFLEQAEEKVKLLEDDGSLSDFGGLKEQELGEHGPEEYNPEGQEEPEIDL